MPIGRFRGGSGGRGRAPASAPAGPPGRVIRACPPAGSERRRGAGRTGRSERGGADAAAKPAGGDEEVRHIRLEVP